MRSFREKAVQSFKISNFLRKSSLYIIIIAVLISIIIMLFQLGRSKIKNNIVIDDKPVTTQDNIHVSSYAKDKEIITPTVVKQEDLVTEQKEEKKQESQIKSKTFTQAETEQTEKKDVISPEYLSIGMILNPDKDIPGAKYVINTDRLGNKLRIPINLPAGYDTIGLGWNGGAIVMILSVDHNHTAIRVDYSKNGVSQIAPPDLAWKLYQESKWAIETLENSPEGSEKWKEAKAVRERLKEEYGSINWHVSKSGNDYPIIVYGPDDKGVYRSIVNP